ncbi:MAG: deoxyribonuclease IV, partial [Nitrospirota bacterium]
NPRGWSVKELSEDDVSLFRLSRTNFDISPVYVHSSYLINMAAKDNTLRRKSIDLLTLEMGRADAIGADFVILHTGSASGNDQHTATKRAIDALNEVARRGDWKAGLLVENTAGERGDICSSIEELSEITNLVKGRLISGICVDTCHAFAAGYNICSNEIIKEISSKIEHYMGRDKTKLIHLNDSKGEVGSRIDRHEHIGFGKIGIKGLSTFINYHSFRNIPIILETPKKRPFDDPMNLNKVREMIF